MLWLVFFYTTTHQLPVTSYVYNILYYIILFLNKKIKSSFGEIKWNAPNTEKILTFLIFKLVSTLSNSML